MDFFQAESRQDTIRNSIDENDASAPLLGHDVEQQTHYELNRLNLGYVTGVIARSRMQTFERVLWRSLRGNLYMNSAEIDEPIVDPDSDEVVEKNVFAIFAHGREIINKIKKISESLGATLYSVDDSPSKRRDALLEVTSRIEDLNNVGPKQESLSGHRLLTSFTRFFQTPVRHAVLNSTRLLKTLLPGRL